MYFLDADTAALFLEIFRSLVAEKIHTSEEIHAVFFYALALSTLYSNRSPFVQFASFILLCTSV